MVNMIVPRNLNDALERMSRQKLTIFAGGTDLMIKRRSQSGGLQFDHDVLLISELQELKTIYANETTLIIGAAATISEILAHPNVPDLFKDPLREIGSVAIRNTATLGGNIVNASPASDVLPMLVALDARVICRSKMRGEFKIAIDTFITSPGRTVLRQDELVTGIAIPMTDFNVFSYVKVGARKANAISKLSFFGAASFNMDKVIDVRFAFGAMGPKVIRDPIIEMNLVHIAMDRWLDEALPAYGALLNPIDDLRSTKAYRKEVALNLLEDFIKKELIR